MFKKIRMWFWTKSKTIEEMMKISNIIDMHDRKLADRLEELDQEKTYVVSIEGGTKEEIALAKHAFEQSAKKMRWTIPKIIFTNAVIKEKKKRGKR